MNAKLDFDATKLFEALKYQIHVAIDLCHSLTKSDVLWIEVFGDVTVEGRDQIEVKDYSDNLTDSHENFWNTLNNWLKPEFRHQQYYNLILLTTQAYGDRTSLKEWENSDAAERLAILEGIHAANEARFKKAEQAVDDAKDGDKGEGKDDKAKRKSVTPSDALKLQRKVMANEIRASLLEALPKIKIITEQPGLQELISKYKIRHLKGIMPHRQDDFVNDLFGFMTSAIKITGGWKFTTDEFDKKIAELTARYLIGTVKFPRLDSDELGKEASRVNVRERLFAQKLEEIGGDEELILQAAADLLHAEQYIDELIEDCATFEVDFEMYSNNQLKMHQHSRSAAMRKINTTTPTKVQLQIESCNFYDSRCAVNVDNFSSYDFTPIEFRNGLYHILADEDPPSSLKQFHWRLWK